MTSPLPLTPGTWTIDPAHSCVNFKVRHLGIANVRGRFDTFAADLEVGEDLASTSLAANIDISSVDTNNEDRDNHLRSSDFFSADANPQMTFACESISDEGDGEYKAAGTLTINGVSKPVTLDVEFVGSESHPADGNLRAGFSAATTINRDDFGIDFNMPLGMDGVAIGKKIAIEIDAEFLAPQA